MRYSVLTVAACAMRAACAASPGDAPQLPIAGARVVRVASEPELQSAMNSLRDGDTILLADGVYNLTRSLYVIDRHEVTIRGTAGRCGVALAGRGMNNPHHGGVPFGVWSNSRNTTIAHLSLRDTWDNLIIINQGARAPRVYCVDLINAGSQFIKSNPTDVRAGRGVDDGVVEHCRFEYTGRPPDDHGWGAGYFNGISAHAARNWIVRDNVFINLHNPDGTAYPWNPAVLFWSHSANTLTERNLFINVDRAVAYGLQDDEGYHDHAGGVIRNNFVILQPGMMSADRTAASDAAILAWNSPGTQIDHNTLLLNGNVRYAIQFRFSRTLGGAARNNLADASIHLRDGAEARLSRNLENADPGMFVDPAAGDLHLLPSAAAAIDAALLLDTVKEDIDGERRPQGAGADIGADEVSARPRPPAGT